MRQAVIVMHGIGEQKPMGTLRRFVNGVLGDPKNPEHTKFHSKPDRMSESFELRKLLAPQTRSRPITDFYEYYWAFHVEGTKYSHIFRWLCNLMFRRPRNVSKRLRPLWVVTWGLVALLALGAAGQTVLPDVFFQSTTTGQRLVPWTVAMLLIPAIHAAVLGYIGDAARYLSPTPTNISTRHRIRADGIRLLRRLHRSGEYDRIIVVGHSLGSVIAYDVLKHLWQEMNAQHGSPLNVDQRALKELERSGMALPKKPSKSDTCIFQRKQRDLWLEQRRNGNPWLVTDLVTVGSPLAHAELLLASGKKELAMRQKEYELPTCPPQSEGRSRYSYNGPTYSTNGQKRTLRILHHAAQFACTRWTNLYFPGDFVGGPLQPIFGRAIRDVRLTGKGLSRPLAYTIASHTRYWHAEGNERHASWLPALEALRAALNLESKAWLT